MISVGWVGLGKLGLPLAITYARAGVIVLAYDTDYPTVESLAAHPSLAYERGVADYLSGHRRTPGGLGIGSLTDALKARVVFLVLPTPGPGLDPSALFEFVDGLDSGWQGSIVVVSTTLPGTCRELAKHLTKGQRLYHLSSYAGMGTVLADEGLSRDIVIGSLDGLTDPDLDAVLDARYGAGWRHRARVVSRETSEMAKLAVNVVASLKVGFSNDMTRLCHATPGADADAVLGIVARDQRASSGRYIGVGMADGGPCHPREVEALERMMHDGAMFHAARAARQNYNYWLASTVMKTRLRRVLIWGTGFKDGVPLTDNSSAVVVAETLRGFGCEVHEYDPTAMSMRMPQGMLVKDVIAKPVAILLATDQGFIGEWIDSVALGSVIVDATRCGCPIAGDGVRYVRLGRGPV
jgi:nucleotide sugar dehydrogenase